MIGKRAPSLLRLFSTAAVLIAICAATAVPAVADGKTRRDIKRRFSATAAPSFHLASWAYPHVDYECGFRGVTFTGERYKAPDDGTLVVEMKGFTGDWDLSLFDEKSGAWLAGSYRSNLFGAAYERMMFYLLRGDVVEIRACNVLGAPTADVTYEFRFGE